MSRKMGTSIRRATMQSLEPRVLFSTTAAANAEQLVAQANNAFAFDLLHQLPADSAGNTFFSPYSADTALEMALQGAKGVTASEMIKALDLPSSALAQAGIEALNQLFATPPANAAYTLSTANRLWVNENLSLLDSFASSSQQTFGASPQSLDFGDPSAAANTINTWVSNQTHGKITNLIPASDLSELTALVITNAIYFKGNWVDAFDASSTQSAAFQINPTEAATVQMMQQTNDFGYYAQSGTDGFQALDLPYQGNDLDMIVILPTTYDVKSFQSTLTPAVFSQITSDMSASNVDVHLPKFELNETYDLVPPLENLGIHSAFTSAADFSGIANGRLSISDVVQKSFIQVDETGTVAAAATGINVTDSAIGYVPPAIPFDANHPFFFAIRQRSTNTILFLGSMNDPSNGTTDYATASTKLEVPASVNDPLTVINNTPIGGTYGVTISETVKTRFTATVADVYIPLFPSNATLGATIHWGNGTTSTGILTTGLPESIVTGTHRYHRKGTFHVEIDVWEKRLGKRSTLNKIESTINVVAAM